MEDDGRKTGFTALISAAAIAAPLIVMSAPVIAGETEVVLSLPGIPGPYCAYGVEKRLFDLDGVSRVVLIWEKEQVRIFVGDGKTVTPDQILSAVEKSDYPYDYKILDR